MIMTRKGAYFILLPVNKSTDENLAYVHAAHAMMCANVYVQFFKTETLSTSDVRRVKAILHYLCTYLHRNQILLLLLSVEVMRECGAGQELVL